jgi:hypothetical protein
MRQIGVFGALLLALFICTSAVAWADPEPDDVLSQAHGPMPSTGPVAAGIQTVNDADWYSLYLLGGQVVTISIDAPSCVSSYGNNASLYATLTDARGAPIDGATATVAIASPTSSIVGDTDVSTPASWTTPYTGADHYYIEVTPDSTFRPDLPCAYTLNLTPGSAVSNTSFEDREAACTHARARYHGALIAYRRAKSLAEHGRHHRSLRGLRATSSKRAAEMRTACRVVTAAEGKTGPAQPARAAQARAIWRTIYAADHMHGCRRLRPMIFPQGSGLFARAIVADARCGDGVIVLRHVAGTRWVILGQGSDWGATSRCQHDIQAVSITLLRRMFGRAICVQAMGEYQVAAWGDAVISKVHGADPALAYLLPHDGTLAHDAGQSSTQQYDWTSSTDDQAHSATVTLSYYVGTQADYAITLDGAPTVRGTITRSTVQKLGFPPDPSDE